MPKGRKRKPPALHALTGRGPGKDAAGRPVNVGPSSGIGLDPDCPPDLFANDPIAVGEWHRALTILNRIPGWIEDSDYPAVFAHCMAFRQYYIVNKQLLKSRTAGDPDAIKRDTATLVSAQKALFQTMACLGFTPVDRQKIVTGGVKVASVVDDFKKKFMEKK